MHRTEIKDSDNSTTERNCSRCGTALPFSAKFCGSCGEPLEKKKNLDISNNSNSLPVNSMLSGSLGWMPVLTITSAVGVLLLSLAAVTGRFALHWADLLFWIGLLVLFLPVAIRIISPNATRLERIALLFLLGIALYLIRFLDYPLSFAYDDEFAHWQGARDIAATGHLFHANPIIPIIPYYPGLEIATNAVSSMTGLSIFISGGIVLLVAGMLLIPSFFLFFEQISKSARVAGIATLLCTANPGLFSDTQFAYESLALPLAVFVLFVVAYRSNISLGQRKGLTLMIWLSLAAVVITHHVTSFGLVAFLFLWTTLFVFSWIKTIFRNKSDRKELTDPGWSAFVGLILIILWTLFTAGRVIAYLYPTLQITINEIGQVLSRQTATRQLFRDGSGSVAPLWERLTAFASVGFLSIGILFGLYILWKRRHSNAATLSLAAGAIVYPLSQLALLTPIGDTTVGRAQEFLFPAAAFIMAIGVAGFWLSRVPGRGRYSLLLGVILVIFVGGWITGTGSLWYRLPGPYLVSADHRSISPDGIAAAEWAAVYLGPRHRFVGARADTYLMGTYGNQWVITFAADKIEVAPVFTSAQFGPIEKGILKGATVQYLVVDLRLSTGLPRTGSYFNVEEPNAQHYTKPIDPSALTKFDGLESVDRIYDNGNIVIYNVEAVTANPLTPQSCLSMKATSNSSSTPQVARNYTGIIFDIASSHAVKMTLTGILQQRGNFCGTFSAFGATLPFTGSIASDHSLQFVVTNAAGRILLTFDGYLHSDGTIAGSFCRSEAGQCSDYGLWSLAPGT